MSGARPPAEHRARTRKPASPEGEAGSLRANGKRRRRPVPTPAHVCLSQSGGGQLRHSWDKLPSSRARLCAAAEERERRWGCGQPGSGDSAPSPRESTGWLWEALLRRDFGFWVPSLHRTSCSRSSKSPAVFFSGSCAVQGCRALCQVSVYKKADFSLRGSKPLVPLLSCVTVGSFLPGYPTMGHVTDRSLCHRTLGYSLCPLSFSVMKFDYCVNTSKNIK